jgi:rhamnosyltransferase
LNQADNTLSTVAVVTTFNPDLSILREQLSRTVPQVEQLIVVDNGSSAADSIRALVEEFTNTLWCGLRENRGLAHAHNVGIQQALEWSAESVLMLDQDTLPEANMVRALAETLASSRASDSRVAAVGARYVGAQSRHPSFFVQFRRFRFKKCFCTKGSVRQVIPADVLISSGALFSVIALREIGGMDEGLFIDHVDTEWFLRAHHRGWRSYGVCDAVMRHSLGDRTFRVWLGRWRYLPIHKPFRYYYIYRNSVLLYRRSYPTLRWKQTDVLRLLMMFVVFTLFAGERVQNYKMMCLGIIHGVKGKLGPLVLND